MLILAILVILLANIVISLYLKKHKTLRKFPTGPQGLPIVGNLFSIGFNLKDAFNNWRKQYGDIVGFNLGGKPCIVINNFEMLNEAFKDDRFTGRPESLKECFHAFFQGDENEASTGGIVFAEGEAWKEQRRFAMRTLKEFGAGKSSIQHLMNDEVSKLVDVFKKNTNKPVSLKNQTNMAVVNTLWQILNGKKSDLSDPQMQRVFASTSTFIEENNLCGPMMIMPWLRHLPVFKGMFEKARSSPQEMRKVTSKSIEEHRSSYDEEHTRDFVDCYIKKMNETQETESSFYKGHGEGNMQRVMCDLFGAGSETTSTVLAFSILYMIRYPHIQERVVQEIQEVLGERSATLEDRHNMPYTDAFIHEVLRYACLNYTIPHATTEDVEFHGYQLPAGTPVYANVSWIMNDPDHWDAPEQFNPERFIDSNTGKFLKNDRFIPFLIGKRYCLGQSLAQHQIFLFLVGLLQSFSFSTPLSIPEEVSIEPIVGFMHQCPEYQVVLSPRH